MNKALACHCRPKEEIGHEIGCVLAIDFKKKDGDSFMDRSVYGHLCTPSGGAKWNLDGFDFDGVNGKVELNDNNAASPMNFTTSDFTLEFLVNIDVLGAGDYGVIINRGAHQSDGYYVDARESNKLRFSTDVSGTSWGINFPGFFITGFPIHGAAMKSGGDFRIYKNGDLVASVTGRGNPASSTCPTRIGVYGDGTVNYMDGRIPSVKIFRQAEYAARVLQRAIEARRG